MRDRAAAGVGRCGGCVGEVCEEACARREPGGSALVVHRGADEEDEEVEAPHHLREPQQREVFADVVVREVAEARHPDVRRDVDPDRVVDLRRL